MYCRLPTVTSPFSHAFLAVIYHGFKPAGAALACHRTRSHYLLPSAAFSAGLDRPYVAFTVSVVSLSRADPARHGFPVGHGESVASAFTHRIKGRIVTYCATALREKRYRMPFCNLVCVSGHCHAGVSTRAVIGECYVCSDQKCGRRSEETSERLH